MHNPCPETANSCSIVIPNVIPAVEAASHAGERKPVWRLAFFSRLEERKGIKLFVETIDKLVATRFDFDSRCSLTKALKKYPSLSRLRVLSCSLNCKPVTKHRCTATSL